MRRGVPRESTIRGTVRALARSPASNIFSELDRLQSYWPNLLRAVVARAWWLPPAHHNQLILWLVEQYVREGLPPSE